MFTSAQKVADAQVNSRIFFLLIVLGALFGVAAWAFFLPKELAAGGVPLWRLVWSLFSDQAARSWWEHNFSLMTRLSYFVGGGAIALPLLAASISKALKPHPKTHK